MATPEQDSGPAWALGLCDAIFGFGVLLANAGLLSREEIAAAFEQAVEQGTERALESGQDPTQRTVMSRMLAQAFRLPRVGDRRGIRVVAVDGAPMEGSGAAE
jgi:hypothetical protein